MKGLNPKTLERIAYCNSHNAFINLFPSVVNGGGKGEVFRIACSDCGKIGPWKKSVNAAIKAWNEENK